MTQAQAAASPAPGDSAAPSSSPSTPLALPPELLENLAPDLRPAPVTSQDGDDAAEAGTPTAAPDATAPAAGQEPPADAKADDAGDQPAAPEPTVSDLADQLLDNPQLISRVPRGKLSEVVAEYNQRMAAVRDHFYAEGVKAGQANALAAAQQQTLAQQAQEIEALIDPNSDTYAPELYAERVAAFPGGRKAFARVVAEMTPNPAGSAEDYGERAKSIIQRELGSLPNRGELVAELQKNWNYPANEEGLLKLASDIGALKARGATNTPAAQELQKRQQGLKTLQQAPKPDVSEGRTSPIDGLPTPEQVKTMSPEELAALEAKKPGTLVALAKAAVAAQK